MISALLSGNLSLLKRHAGKVRAIHSVFGDAVSNELDVKDWRATKTNDNAAFVELMLP